QGLFKFNTDSKVIECNENCTCPTNCTNRVAQRPRQIPIDIFKTEKRGWGARTSDVLVRGQVLGLYTGCVSFRREKAHKLFGKRASYIFELDIDEEPGDSPRDAYSVDAFHCGNWTRFINHSCSPNVQVIAVAYDTVDDDTPYVLAFVAIEKICPGTELTLDYSPAKQGAWERKKYKDEARVKKQPRCLCGTKECRGWMA
ncbi:hypothetical protein B0H13DRAFT_1604908, partial [Mycena leptocephala]